MSRSGEDRVIRSVSGVVGSPSKSSTTHRCTVRSTWPRWKSPWMRCMHKRVDGSGPYGPQADRGNAPAPSPTTLLSSSTDDDEVDDAARAARSAMHGQLPMSLANLAAGRRAFGVA